MIDKATVDKIFDAVNIVDVVSDFVALKQRGTNWVGLCPFHNDRRPSFYVSPSKGVCKCFSCGHGGSAVSFIMDHEQMTYVEALRYLAKKYHIELHERELTDEEQRQQTERESMLVVNEWAMGWFEDQLHNTQAGRDIGLSYFNERAFTTESIRKFHLGYSPERSRALYDAAIRAGYSREVLIATGLCIDDQRGGCYDRFRGRVMFPIFNVAGKVVAFGGRTLKHDPAKYVNSPESLIYNKRNELYGLFQAKRAIGKHDKCFIVEGYADVISMHQAGFENVIASSGTALTEGHIAKVRRFTSNVTELFDGDAAGIHAALRGVDMLLHNGLDIKVLILPEPEDPDSFARSHSATEIEDYIKQHETDFIRFKVQTLLADSAGDPIKKAAAITDIIKSIAVIPDPIKRNVYAQECSMLFAMDVDVILGEIAKHVGRFAADERKRVEREQRQAQAGSGQQPAPAAASPQPAGTPSTAAHSQPASTAQKADKMLKAVHKCEYEIIRLTAKYGMCELIDTDADGEPVSETLVEYFKGELDFDSIAFSNPTYATMWTEATGQLDAFHADHRAFREKMAAERQARIAAGIDKIRTDGLDNTDEILLKERMLTDQIDSDIAAQEQEFRKSYLEKHLVVSPDDVVRKLSESLVFDKYQLSRIHGDVAANFYTDSLPLLAYDAVNSLKYAIVNHQLSEISKQIAHADNDTALQLMQQMQQLQAQRKQLATISGDRVVNPN